MLHIHNINLQQIVGGGEIYTRTLTRALADAGARVTLYVHPQNRFWDNLAGDHIEVLQIADEHLLPERLPGDGSVVLIQCPISDRCVERMAAKHFVAGFSHMPMFQRGAEAMRKWRLVFTVSRYCIDLLGASGLTNVYPEPVYGAADIERSRESVIRRSPYIVDQRKLRDVLLAKLAPLAELWRTQCEFSRLPGVTLGVVSLIGPIKQFPLLFSILAPILARHESVNMEIFGSGSYAQVRDLRRALAPLGHRARFWGYQKNVSAIYPQLDFLMTGLPEKEALGLNALEAQFCGTPVLAPNAPPFTETVADGASGFLYRDPREDGGRHFAEILDSILAGRPRPDPRLAKEHLQKFSYPGLVERARRLLQVLSNPQ